MTKFTAQWIDTEVFERKISELPHHSCGVCDEWTRYLFAGGFVFYDSSCGCAYSEPRLKSYEDVAGWLAMQSSDEIREEIWSRVVAQAD